MKQELLFIPESRNVPWPDDKPVPNHVWTLFGEGPHSLPFYPRHWTNAFIEDKIHDWDISKGVFRYYSRVSEGGVWILLEWEEPI